MTSWLLKLKCEQPSQSQKKDPGITIDVDIMGKTSISTGSLYFETLPGSANFKGKTIKRKPFSCVFD